MEKKEKKIDIIVSENYDNSPKNFFEKLYTLIIEIIKRIIDIVGALVGIILLIPITVIIIIINFIFRESGPIFYTQERIGKNGKHFKMLKYRSMIVGADEVLEEYLKNNEEARREYKINKKLKNDPRITKVGKIIRRASLDEFPQFINILIGQMSLVGPRPYLPREKEDMGSYFPYIVDVKPGLTGLWQISGRNDVTFQDRLEFDLEYYKNRSLKLYIGILFRTLFIVFRKEGAR